MKDKAFSHPLFEGSAFEWIWLGAVAAIGVLYVAWSSGVLGAPVSLPYASGGDGIEMEVIVKSIIENGWFTVNPRLGTPGALNWADYPVGNYFFHFLLLKILGLMRPQYTWVLNTYYLFSSGLVAGSSFYVSRRIGFRRLVAAVISLLYCGLPYHFQRGMGHLPLGVYFVVPWSVWLAWRIDENKPRSWFSDVALAVFVGTCGVYYSYFSCVIWMIAGVTSWRRHAILMPLKRAIVCCVMACTFVALCENATIIERARFGPNTWAASRSPAESELYGLKLAQLLLPVEGHRIAAFAKLRQTYDQTAPLNNENGFATLGLVGAIGFLVLLGTIFLAGGESTFLASLSRFNAACVLLGTIGGLGAMIAMTISPMIRCYNRISIFIAFLALLAAGELLNRVWTKLEANGKQVVAAALVAVVGYFGALDETSRIFKFDTKYNAYAFAAQKKLFSKMESALPVGSRVFELPYFPFPETPPMFSLPDYELATPYLFTDHLRFTYAAVKGRFLSDWLASLAALPFDDMSRTLKANDFGAVLVNRKGYADHGNGIEHELSARLGPPIVRDDTWMLYKL